MVFDALNAVSVSIFPSEAPRRDDAAAAGHGEEHQDLEGGGVQWLFDI